MNDSYQWISLIAFSIACFVSGYFVADALINAYKRKNMIQGLFHTVTISYTESDGVHKRKTYKTNNAKVLIKSILENNKKAAENSKKEALD
jgi:F0F1-type ATP synthase membrane subunit b/b'